MQRPGRSSGQEQLGKVRVENPTFDRGGKGGEKRTGGGGGTREREMEANNDVNGSASYVTDLLGDAGPTYALVSSTVCHQKGKPDSSIRRQPPTRDMQAMTFGKFPDRLYIRIRNHH